MRVLSVNKLQEFASKLYTNFSEVIQEVKESREHPYKIAGWVKQESLDKDVLIYRVVGTDKHISSFSVTEIYNNDSILYGFSKQEVKYISTLAVMVGYKSTPKYTVVWRGFRDGLENQMIHLADRDKPGVIKASITELENNISLIDGMSSSEAFKLGKEAGVLERLKEEQVINGQ